MTIDRAPNQEGPADQIGKILERFTQGWNEGDIDSLLPDYHPEAVIVGVSGPDQDIRTPLASGTEALRHFYTAAHEDTPDLKLKLVMNQAPEMVELPAEVPDAVRGEYNNTGLKVEITAFAISTNGDEHELYTFNDYFVEQPGEDGESNLVCVLAEMPHQPKSDSDEA